MNGEQCRGGMRWLWHIWIFCPCTSFGKLKKAKSIWQNSRSVKRIETLYLRKEIYRASKTRTYLEVKICMQKFRLTNFEKRTLASFFLSVRLSVYSSVRMEQLRSHCTDFHEILISHFFFSKVCPVIFIFIPCKRIRYKVKQPTTCTSVFCF